MANILNPRAIFFFFCKFSSSGKQKQKSLEAEDLFESKKVKGSNIVNCAQKKHFSYITDKIVSLRRNFSKDLVILS